METKMVEQVLIFVLRMTHTADPAEYVRNVVLAFDYDSIVNFYNQEHTIEYHTNAYGHRTPFREGSKLALFNPVPSLELGDLDTFGNGIMDLWVTWDEYNYLKNRVSIVLE